MMEVAVKQYPISVQMYHIMAEHGAFAPDDRVELFEGEIIEMSPIGKRHSRVVDLLTRFFVLFVKDAFIVRVQNPIILNDLSEPQPDISVVRFREDFYKDELPKAADVSLIIEVSDVSVAFDRSKKFPKYGAAGIPEAWLIDLESERVEVHSVTKEATYGLVKIYGRGENVVSETMPGLELSVDSIFG